MSEDLDMAWSLWTFLDKKDFFMGSHPGPTIEMRGKIQVAPKLNLDNQLSPKAIPPQRLVTPERAIVAEAPKVPVPPPGPPPGFEHHHERRRRTSSRRAERTASEEAKREEEKEAKRKEREEAKRVWEEDQQKAREAEAAAAAAQKEAEELLEKERLETSRKMLEKMADLKKENELLQEKIEKMAPTEMTVKSEKSPSEKLEEDLFNF